MCYCLYPIGISTIESNQAWRIPQATQTDIKFCKLWIQCRYYIFILYLWFYPYKYIDTYIHNIECHIFVFFRTLGYFLDKNILCHFYKILVHFNVYLQGGLYTNGIFVVCLFITNIRIKYIIDCLQELFWAITSIFTFSLWNINLPV